MAGISRSASVVIAYLIADHMITLENVSQIWFECFSFNNSDYYNDNNNDNDNNNNNNNIILQE